MMGRLPTTNPPLLVDADLERVLCADVESLSGTALKQYEDRFDTILCDLWGVLLRHKGR